jgi:hypothetical protein
VRVEITLFGQKLHSFVWPSYYACEHHTLRLNITLCVWASHYASEHHTMYVKITLYEWTLRWVFLQFCRNWSRLTLQKLWWIVKSISAYIFFFFRFVGCPEALKIENFHMQVKNWSCPIYQFGTFSYCKLLADSKNVKILWFEGQFQPHSISTTFHIIKN